MNTDFVQFSNCNFILTKHILCTLCKMLIIVQIKTHLISPSLCTIQEEVMNEGREREREWGERDHRE